MYFDSTSTNSRNVEPNSKGGGLLAIKAADFAKELAIYRIVRLSLERKVHLAIFNEYSKSVSRLLLR